MIARGGFCTLRIGLGMRGSNPYCTRKATTIATDPSGKEREICTQHRHKLPDFWSATRPIERARVSAEETS